MVEACIAGGLQDLLKHLGGLSFDFRFSSFLAVKDSIHGLACGLWGLVYFLFPCAFFSYLIFFASGVSLESKDMVLGI